MLRTCHYHCAATYKPVTLMEFSARYKAAKAEQGFTGSFTDFARDPKHRPPADKLFLHKNNVETYEIVGEDKKTSAASAVMRGAVGTMLLGPVGIAAAFSAKKKGVHTIAIEFKDGKKSLLEVDDNICKAIKMKLF